MSYDSNRGAQRARMAREELGLGLDGPLADVLDAVEGPGAVPVLVADLGGETAGAYKPDFPLIFVNGRQAVRRQRFTVAHEFGHHRLGHHERKLLDTPADMAGRTHDPQEVQANAFAAEFLAPAQAVRAWWSAAQPETVDLEVVVRLASDFGISAPAALYRLTALRVLGDQARIRRLEREIEEDLHVALGRRFGLAERSDALALTAAAGGTRLPAALRGSPLGRLFAGELSLEEAARAVGRPVAELAAALEALRI